MDLLASLSALLNGGQLPVVRPAELGGSVGVPLPQPNPMRTEPRTSGVMAERQRNGAAPIAGQSQAGAGPAATAAPMVTQSMPANQGGGLLSGIKIPGLSGETDLGSALRSVAAGIGNVDTNGNTFQQAAQGFLGSSTVGQQLRERNQARERLDAAIEAMSLTPQQKAAAKADPSIAAELIKSSVTSQKPELTTVYNDDGTEQRAWVYPDGRAFPVGGRKPAAVDTSPTTQKFYDPATKSTVIKQYDPRTNDWIPIGTSKGSDGDAGPKFSDVTSARKDFENQPGVSRYRTAAPILSSMTKSIDDPSTMADLDFIYGMAKIYDPTSVVRESEMGLVIQGQSLPAQIVGTFNKVANGQQSLGPQVRKDLVKASLTRVGEYRSQAEREAEEFSGLAQRNGIDPQDVVRPLEAMPEFSDSAAKAATTPNPNGSPSLDELLAEKRRRQGYNDVPVTP